MSNNFKPNTRFDVLNETPENEKVKINKKKQNSTKQKTVEPVVPEVKKNNTFKNDNPTQNYYQKQNHNYTHIYSNTFDTKKRKEQIEKENLQKELNLKEIREKEKTESLKETNFPDLVTKSNKKNNKQSTSLNFLEKANTVRSDKNETQPIINKIPYGICEISFDKKSRKIIYNTGEQTKINNYDYEEETNPSFVLNSVVNFHNKRKTEYIELWGEEEYNKMFVSPNYDYHYFDKLDQKYEENMELLREHDIEEYYE